MMNKDFRPEKLQEAAAAVDILHEITGDEIIFPGLVSSVEEGEAAGNLFSTEAVYAIVVLPTIASMAATPWAALQNHDLPLVVWSQAPENPFPPTITKQVSETGSVGALAIGNVLVRHQRLFVSTSGPVISERAQQFLSGARAAAHLSGAKLAHIGGSWAGMLDVMLDYDALEKKMGLRFQSLDPDDTGPPISEDKLSIVDLDPDIYEKSCLLAGHIVAAVERENIIGGAIACHGDWISENPKYGVVACLAVNYLTRHNIPFACTGDDCTAVALCLAIALGGTAQYFEMDPPNPQLNAVMLSSGGEGDLRLASSCPAPKLCHNHFFDGHFGHGIAHDFILAPGPATLINFTPIGDNFKIIAAEGEVLEEQPPALGMPRTLFRFAGPVRDAFDAWCEAGANHHLALTMGHHGLASKTFSNAKRIEFEQVT